MSLYYEAAEVLAAPTNAGGSLKSKIFNDGKTFKSQPAQIYALAIETCKWSLVLKEIIEHATLLSLERKVYFTDTIL
jgi:putative methyltransferase